MILKYRRLINLLIGIIMLSLLSSCGLSYLLTTNGKSIAKIISLNLSSAMEETMLTKQTIRVITLNIAHGRKDGFSQLLQSTNSIRNNLNSIGSVLRQVKPDIVALQEADGPSFWSGGFSHVHYLTKNIGFKYAVRGLHVHGLKLSYGTAILSRLPLQDAQSFNFALSPPSFPKGYVIATLNWQGKNSHLAIDVVSLHLDFLRSSVRKKQIKNLIKTLMNRDNAFIIMGDFNTDWKDSSAILPLLSQQLKLQAYQPLTEDKELITFPLINKRLDWIFISEDLRFSKYQVLQDNLSDHKAVVAEIQIDN